jgi:hypothetical protein
LGWHTFTYRRLPIAQTPADPDATAGLRHQHPSQGFRRAWAALRYDERREANKKVHRLWREEGLQVRLRSPRKRAGATRHTLEQRLNRIIQQPATKENS